MGFQDLIDLIIIMIIPTAVKNRTKALLMIFFANLYIWIQFTYSRTLDLDKCDYKKVQIARK